MASAVLDSSAVVAVLRSEPGADFIVDFAGDALISAVNLQEVIKAMFVHGYREPVVSEMLSQFEFDVCAHEAEDAWAAARLVEPTRSIGSGLGDRSCMALAIKVGQPAITTDKEWAELAIPGLQVILAR